jgi:hypothetical protein
MNINNLGASVTNGKSILQELMDVTSVLVSMSDQPNILVNLESDISLQNSK